MIIIYPTDPSTKFLKEIVTNIAKYTDFDFDNVKPEEYDQTLDFLADKEDSNTILFLGHGYSDGLYGGCYVPSGKKILISKKNADQILLDKKIILFACKSSEFLKSLNNIFHVAIGFGNIKTDKEDLVNRKEKKRYRDYNIFIIFRKNLVTLFSKSIEESILEGYNFQQFYNLLKLRMNKCICKLSLSREPIDKLVAELMFELKTEMILIGNKNAKVH